MSIDRALFQTPPAQYRVRPMTHGWPEARKEYMQALKEYGFGGVVTNVPHENGFTQNPENLKEFQRILDDLKDAGLSYWIYDENGYPSGYGGGLVLEGHPELEAKGFYMRRKSPMRKSMCPFIWTKNRIKLYGLPNILLILRFVWTTVLSNQKKWFPFLLPTNWQNAIWILTGFFTRLFQSQLTRARTALIMYVLIPAISM